MTATLDLPVNIVISMLRKAGTGDSLLAALDAIVNISDVAEVEEETHEPTEWVNAVNLEDDSAESATVDLN